MEYLQRDIEGYTIVWDDINGYLYRFSPEELMDMGEPLGVKPWSKVSFDEEHRVDKYAVEEYGQVVWKLAPEFEFSYEGFFIQSVPFDQTGNGYPEDGITYMASVWHSKADYDHLEDEDETFRETYDSQDDLKKGIIKRLNKYLKKKRRK